MLILFLASTLNADVYEAHTYKVFHIRIHHHLFDPDIIVVPAHVIIKLGFENQDDQAEKIFSHSLNVEKIILGHSSGFVFIGPLEEGDYPLRGRFFSRSMIGVVQAVRQ